MFLHTHPYEPYIPEDATKLVVGTLPPPRFTTGELKAGDVNFCYGSRDGQLWPILDRIFDLKLKFETTPEATQQRKDFLHRRQIGICDIVASAQREKIDATDLGMQDVELRDLVSYLKQYPSVHTLLFTGGNSKNGPEYFFRRHLKTYGLKLKVVNDQVPRIHQFVIPNENEESHDGISPAGRNDKKRIIKTVSLTAPSGSANRAVGSMELYKQLKNADPSFNTLDFRVLQYREFF